MKIFPFKKTVIYFPVNTEEFCERLNKLDGYDISIRNNTFQLMYVPRRLRKNKLSWTDFKGEFYAQGNMTKVVLQPESLYIRRKYKDCLIVIILIIMNMFSIFLLGDIPIKDSIQGFFLQECILFFI